jgi:hypothetical protein
MESMDLERPWPRERTICGGIVQRAMNARPSAKPGSRADGWKAACGCPSGVALYGNFGNKYRFTYSVAIEGFGTVLAALARTDYGHAMEI